MAARRHASRLHSPSTPRLPCFVAVEGAGERSPAHEKKAGAASLEDDSSGSVPASPLALATGDHGSAPPSPVVLATSGSGFPEPAVVPYPKEVMVEWLRKATEGTAGSAGLEDDGLEAEPLMGAPEKNEWLEAHLSLTRSSSSSKRVAGRQPSFSKKHAASSKHGKKKGRAPRSPHQSSESAATVAAADSHADSMHDDSSLLRV